MNDRFASEIIIAGRKLQTKVFERKSDKYFANRHFPFIVSQNVKSYNKKRSTNITIVLLVSMI